MWDLRHQSVAEWRPQGFDADAVAISPDFKYLVYGNGKYDGAKVGVWSIEKRKLVRWLEGFRHNVVKICFSSDGSMLAAGDFSGLVKIWDLLKHKEVGSAELKDPIKTLIFSPDGRFLGIGCYKDRFVIWDVKRRRQERTLRSGIDMCMCAAFSPDGKWLAVGGRHLDKKGQVSGELCVWKTGTWKLLHDLRKEHALPTIAVDVSPDSKVLASGSYDGVLNLWHFKK
jgi:WD40 repeat protein